MAYVTIDDLKVFAPTIEAEKATAMIQDAEAQAMLVAPCLEDPSQLSDAQRAAVKAVLRGAILRWHDAGSGAVQQQTAGPFSMMLDNRQTRRDLFWPSEIEKLQAVCAAVTGGSGGAFSIDTVPSCTANHAEVCSVVFGAYCSCGADLAGHPLNEA